MLIIIIELLVVLLALYLGSKYGSLALGAIAGLGLAILVFDHGLKPGTPPTDVIYIIVKRRHLCWCASGIWWYGLDDPNRRAYPS